ncbi:MAG: aldo/keto reductase [Ferrovibrionaceae bacterium]
MEYRQLGASGLKVPALSFGTATFGGQGDFYKVWGSTDADEARRLVDIALDAGVCLFDTADSYSGGMAEEILGAAIAGRRRQVLISTKSTFRLGPGANDVGSSRHRLIAACEASLRRLGIDHIDLWQMHGFDAATPIEETMRALDDLVTAGKVRYVGCSNFSGWHLMKSLAISDRHGWVRHVAHQAYYSLVGRDYEAELMPLALDQGVGTVAWSPLAGGLLSGKIRRDRPPAEGTRMSVQDGPGRHYPREQLYAVVDLLDEIAAEAGRSVSQVALNWVMHRPTVATVVIGARTEAQLRDNLGAAGFRLTADQVARLDQVSARPLPYPYWHQRLTLPDRNPPPV